MPYLSEEKNGGTVIRLFVQPKSSSNRITGIHGDAVKVCIAAPPVEGRANSEIIKFLAKIFHLPKTAVSIKSGHQSRTKRFLLAGLAPADAEKIVRRHLP